MRLLFYYSAERIFKDPQGNLYASGNFTPEVWERYISIADELTVVMTDSGRVIPQEEAQRSKHIIDTKKFDVVLLPDKYTSLKSFFSLKRKRLSDKKEKETFDKCDFAIIRSANTSVLSRCRKWGIPYAVEVVGCLWDAFWNHSLKGKLMAPYEFFIAKYNASKAPYALYVTNEFLQKRYPAKKAVTVSCSDVSLYHLDEKVLEERIEKIKNHSGTYVLGTAAACNVRYKGQQFVIKALAHLKKQGLENFRYDVVGSGDPSYLLKVAEKLGVADKVNIVGQLSHDKVMEWLKSIDLYIQPSLQEGLPRAVIEAMSMGVPCTGTNIAGMPELISEDLLFSRKNVREIASIIENLDTEREIKAANENFQKAKEYDAKLLSRRRAEFYKNFREYAKAHPWH